MFKQVFDYENYRDFLGDYFKSLPKAGFGQLSKAAKALDVQPSLLTGILRGAKNMTPEQALEFAHYSGLSELESEYFTTLVSFERAGTQRLKTHLQTKMNDIREKSSLLKNRLPPKAELPEQVKAQFYSEWYYSAIRLSASIEKINSVDHFAEFLGLPRQTIKKVLEFLILNDLVRQADSGYFIGPQSTHIGSGEMLVSRHHTNWRLKAIEQINRDAKEGLYFTSPVSIALKDIDVVRNILMRSIDEIFGVIDPSMPEQVAVLNIDWFKLNR